MVMAMGILGFLLFMFSLQVLDNPPEGLFFAKPSGFGHQAEPFKRPIRQSAAGDSRQHFFFYAQG